MKPQTIELSPREIAGLTARLTARAQADQNLNAYGQGIVDSRGLDGQWSFDIKRGVAVQMPQRPPIDPATAPAAEPPAEPA